MTFARLAKLLAVLLVAIALWRARPPAPPAHVVVLALPGATMDLLAPGGGSGGSIRLPKPTSGAAFWRRLLAFDDDESGEPADMTPLWSDQRGAIRALSVPAHLFGPLDAAAVVEQAFVGSSGGAIVEAVDITSGRLPYPHDRAAAAVAITAAALRREEWSDWIDVEPPPGSATPTAVAQFQFVRFSDSAYFFSPAYAASTSATVASPFLRGVDRELRPIVAAHLIALSRRRLEPSRTLFAQGSDRGAVVVFDGVAEDTTAVFTPDSTPAAVREEVRDAIAAEVAALRAAVGSDGLVVVVGGPSTVREPSSEGWYRLLTGADAGGPGPDAGSPLDFEAARALVLYATAVSLGAAEKSLVPAALTSRFPIRATVARLPAAARPGAPHSAWSTATLDSVPGAVGGGH